ncbi:MAG: STAS domain-containing protein [Acidobacteria bacterium]|nr:STAS domain-containing protein [Acidobacteriota bacterium]
MSQPQPASSSPSPRRDEEIAIIYADDYINKPSAMRIERECLLRLETGCRALIINFKGTELVNSIGISILLGVIEAAERKNTRVVFAAASRQTVKLFDLLGLTRHVALAESEESALATLSDFESNNSRSGH